ncbi:MAG: sensor histidine kinase, partial [Limisphaerales bacterium]
DANGRLWISAGDDEDLFVRENGEFKEVQPVVRGVKTILAGRNGRIWIGAKGGLYFADPPGNFQVYKQVPKHYVHALAEDDAGALWAGAGNGDLYRVAGGAVTAFHPADTQESEAIWSVLADKDGTIWSGTFRGGLLRLRNGKFTRFNKEDGLPDNVICQILDDGRGNLWLGSHHGIFCVSKSALNADARGKIKIVPVTTYGQYDGLPSPECSGNYQPAAWRSRDGRLWFSTIKGVVFTEPGAIQKNLVPPPVVIEDFLVDGKSFEDGKWRIEYEKEQAGGSRPSSILHPPSSLRIPPGARRFEFRFAGLSLASPNEVRFRYKLEGFEKDWVEAGTQRSAQYSFLPPGGYRFHVIACNSDGVWNETGSVLALKILPHFYEIWWFRALVALTILAAVAGTVRYTATRRLRQKMEQLKRQQAVERERTRIAKDLHDDLGASLTLIAVLGDLAKKEKTGQRIEKISGTAREAVKSLDEIVWAVNPGNDTLAHLIDYAGQFATDYLRAAGIRCLLDVPEQTPAREVPSNVRHNVFLVIKEALQNIVK